jgi:hypothetical protein
MLIYLHVIKPKAMTNFTLKFGKYKGQDIFSTPLDYQDWLLKQKFVARQEDFDMINEGDKIVINYRTYNKIKRRYELTKHEYTFVKQLDKCIVVLYIDNCIYLDLNGKNYQPLKLKKDRILKSTIASIEIL